jgi:hypothetical protein
MFRKINTVLQTCQRELLLDPPPLPVFSPNPVAGFVVREGRGGIALKVKVSPDVRWEDRPALEDLMVFAWAPCNPGVDKNSHYAFLGLLPAPARGESDITKLYLKKLKEWRKLKHKSYHIPLEGSRIFIRVWQQVNGWEQELATLGGEKGLRLQEEYRNNTGRIQTVSGRARLKHANLPPCTRQPPALATGLGISHSD